MLHNCYVMKKEIYSEKLKDPRWQKKRLEILNRDEFACRFCGDNKSTLNVHHISYCENPWETDDKLLVTLCEECHNDETERLKISEKNLIKSLKKCGFTSASMDGLSKVFKDTDRGWSFYEPSFDILKYIVDNDNIWNISDSLFWKSLFVENIRKENKSDDFNF